jgi:hypothetical protein
VRKNGCVWPIAVLIMLFWVSCGPEIEAGVQLQTQSNQIEINKSMPLSALAVGSGDGIPQIEWSSQRGSIVESLVFGEVDYQAPSIAGMDVIRVTVTLNDSVFTDEIEIEVLEEGALKRNSLVLIQVDTNTLQGVYVDEEHPSEDFVPPLLIKGTFRFDPETGEAFAGGSWPNFTMYDDGTNGDPVADDGIWSILFNFEKTDEKVYFAFDDSNPYRVQYESGLTWRLKTEWLAMDDFPNDNSNPAFAPDSDKVLIWDAAMAEEAGIYSKP